MYKKVTIDGKELEFTANAATPYRYKQVFHRDLLKILGNEENAESEGLEAVTELAFIMTKQAERVDMGKLNYEEFITWLEGFGPMAFIDAAEEIIGVYMDSQKTTSTP